MNEKELYEKALAEAVFTLVSLNDNELEAEEIMKMWKKGKEPEGVSLWQPFEYSSPDYLYETADGFRAQFERFGRELLEEAGK